MDKRNSFPNNITRTTRSSIKKDTQENEAKKVEENLNNSFNNSILENSKNNISEEISNSQDKKIKRKKRALSIHSDDDSEFETELNKKTKSNKTKKVSKDDSTISVKSNQVKKNITKEKVSKPKSKEKTQKKNYTEKEAYVIIKNFMLSQNRPYSLQNVIDLLQGQISKAPATKIMTQLVVEDILIVKDYNSKIYLANQNNFEVIDEKLMTEIELKIEETKSNLNQIKEINNQLNYELKNLKEELSNEELDRRLIENRKQVLELEKIINNCSTTKIEEIPDDKIKEAEINYENLKIKHRKTKRACLNILDYVGENTDLTRTQLFELLCLEQENEMTDKLKIKLI